MGETSSEHGAPTPSIKYIQLLLGWDRRNDEIYRLECYLRDTDEMTDKFDSAICSPVSKVEDRWPTRYIPYLAVSVLLPRWEDNDLGVIREIAELNDLLTRFFWYNIEI